jgi:hypothetical protein
MDSKDLQSVASRAHLGEAQARSLYDLLSKIDMQAQTTLALDGERAKGISRFKDIARREWFDFGQSGITHFFHTRILRSYAWRPFLFADELKYLDLIDRLAAFHSLPYREMKEWGYVRRWESKYDHLPFYAQITKLSELEVYVKTAGRRDVATALISGDQIFLALLAYRDSFGQYPSTLGELRSRLGWKLREDPFSGKDFVYRRDGKGFVLYSVGEILQTRRGETCDRNLPEWKSFLEWRGTPWRMVR